YSTQVVLWLFALGWMIQRAATTAQRWLTVAVTLVLVPTFFGADALRTVIVVGGLLLLLFRPTLTVPRVVASAVTTVAAASLGIYLTHFGVLPLSASGFPPVVVVVVAITVGIAATWALESLLRCITRRWRAHGPAPALLAVVDSAETDCGVVVAGPAGPRHGHDHRLAA
ncbi:MAG: hypothetical protein JOY78_15750, partial [Pseudonocardia sp.]|nr:hypothetical protein [Pseudonocardia sp.]